MFLTASKISQELDISVATLTRWYEWYNDPQFVKPENMPILPPYHQATVRSPRYWKKTDIPKIKAFQEWLPVGRKGVMGAYNSRFWGGR